ncbi:MAG: hypothetical protein ACO3BH_05930 [Quisquiliibacterium sp.]|jgi:hypothetical protein
MKTIFVGGVAMLAIVLSGCASPTTPRLDAAFGESVRQARAMQTINPAGSSNTDPVAGIDGESGRAALDRYQESFRTPPKTFEVMNIGGSSSTGQ